MKAKANVHVVVDGISRFIPAGEEIPESALSQITNPEVLGVEPVKAPVEDSDTEAEAPKRRTARKKTDK